MLYVFRHLTKCPKRPPLIGLKKYTVDQSGDGVRCCFEMCFNRTGTVLKIISRDLFQETEEKSRVKG